MACAEQNPNAVKIQYGVRRPTHNYNCGTGSSDIDLDRYTNRRLRAALAPVLNSHGIQIP
jgi:hypothetical protein